MQNRRKTAHVPHIRHVGKIGHSRERGQVMAKDTFWVLIETDTDNLGNPDNPQSSEIRDIFRKGDQYGIVDIIRESHIEEIVFKSDK